MNYLVQYFPVRIAAEILPALCRPESPPVYPYRPAAAGKGVLCQMAEKYPAPGWRPPVPRVAPDLDFNTWWFYKNAHLTDQLWSVRACGVRQRHIDQAQSMNLYITNDYTLRQVLELYIKAWECGVKTIYYIRSKSLEVEECESCSA